MCTRRIVQCCLLSWLFITARTIYADTTATTASVPLLLHYQSQLTDGGGSPLATGPVPMEFRITNLQGEVLYAEAQEAAVFNGAVSVMVGNGTDPANGAVLGGIPLAVFRPGDPKLLEVWIDGAPYGQPTEIVSVPFAYWSQMAQQVAPGSITVQELSDNFFEEFAPQLVMSPAYQTALTNVNSANTIGVTSTFAYSAATTLQGVLEDFDNAIKAREIKNVNKSGDTMSGKLAISKGGLDVTGNISISGTVDGVDVGAHHAATAAHGTDGAIVGMNTLNGLLQDIHDGLTIQIATTAQTLATQVSETVTNVENNFSALTQQLTNHTDATQAHGADGAIVGQNTLNTFLAAKMDVSIGATKEYVDTKISTSESEKPPAPTIVAWGNFNGCSMKASVVSCTEKEGFNLDVSTEAVTKLRLNFGTAPGGTSYAVQVTPYGVSCTTMPYVAAKTDAAFDVAMLLGTQPSTCGVSIVVVATQ